jgi:selenocysteine-specific elongation factor
LPEHELRTRQRVRVHLGTAETLARLVMLETDKVSPGDEVWAQLRLENALVARAGDRFVLRSYSPVTTIGGGIIAEPVPPKRKRMSPTDRLQLAQLLGEEADVAILAIVRAASWAGADATRMPIFTPWPRDTVRAAITRLALSGSVVQIGKQLFDPSLRDQARNLVLERVRRFHQESPLRPGIDRDELRRALPPHADPGLADHIIQGLLVGGALLSEGRFLRDPAFQPRLSSDQATAVEHIFTLISAGGLAPPLVTELPVDLRTRTDLNDLLHFLERGGRVSTLGPGMLVARSVLDDAVRQARETLRAEGPLQPAGFKNLFGISRKYLIPLLEYFDRTGLTVRQGEVRELAKP